MSVIHVNNLHKYYQVYEKEAGLAGALMSLVQRKHETVKAVEGISFAIGEGELIGFIGPNGAGKTTTLKCLSGLLYPDKGEVEVLGYTPHERSDGFLRKISLVMGQKNQLWWDLPAVDTYELNKEIYQIPDKKYRKTLNELTELLGMEELINIPVRKLSLGQRMKAELIAALIHAPKLLFLDEPTIGLDVVMQKKIRDFIAEYNRRNDATIILTSHYMDDVAQLCERVIVIDKGKIYFDGKLSELTKKYAENKRITVTLLNKRGRDKLKQYGKIIEGDEHRVVYSVKREEVNKAAAKILSDLPVDDLNIEEPAIEEIIREVFADV